METSNSHYLLYVVLYILIQYFYKWFDGDRNYEFDFLLCDQVISLPSQTCMYKVRITETSSVVKADIIGFRGRY